ncbi:hypothetical protein [Gordonia phthalatica]|uniref:Uncharacterized protein n=1 Tax=Gordonia phthalatica TaxID=1136941 RepID=A0A0N9MPM7_9ACTN|nr:hypothetical protein [Gordonia phthalatica]ALG84156.1 hypothetical protein ACH46_06095 [Gordonia phthalatica]
MKFYRINESATANAESTALNDAGQTIAATFTFDRTISRELMGKNGIFGVTRAVADEFTSHGFTGFEIGQAECAVSEEAEDSQSVSPPDLVLFNVVGKFLHDDFAIGPLNLVTASERAYELMTERDPETATWATEIRVDQ